MTVNASAPCCRRQRASAGRHRTAKPTGRLTTGTGSGIEYPIKINPVRYPVKFNWIDLNWIFYIRRAPRPTSDRPSRPPSGVRRPPSAVAPQSRLRRPVAGGGTRTARACARAGRRGPARARNHAGAMLTCGPWRGASARGPSRISSALRLDISDNAQVSPCHRTPRRHL